jgi:hypothetical protein
VTRREEIDIDDVLYVVGDCLGKADACITAAERLCEQSGAGVITADDDADGADADADDDGHDDDNDPGRVRNNLEHLVESAKESVRAAQYAHRQALAKLDRYCAGPVQGDEPTTVKRRGKA